MDERTFWDEEAENGKWKENSPVFPGAIDKTRRIISMLLEESNLRSKEDRVVVDIAAGNGLVRYLPSWLKVNHSVDISSKMLEQNPSMYKYQADIRNGWPEEVPEPDVLVCGFLMRYLEPEKQLELVGRIVDKLKDGARAFIFDYEAPISISASKPEDKQIKEYNFAVKEIEKMVQELGDCVIERHTYSGEYEFSIFPGPLIVLFSITKKIQE
jgi:hypothetical protein